MSNNLRPHVASFVLFMKDDEVLLQLRKNIRFDGQYGVPSGHLDEGESVTDCAIREIKEEVGIDLKKEDLEFANVSHCNEYNKDYIQFFFVCKNWEGEFENTEPDKCSEMKFFPINNLPDNMVSFVRSGIESILKKEVFSELIK